MTRFTPEGLSALEADADLRLRCVLDELDRLREYLDRDPRPGESEAHFARRRLLEEQELRTSIFAAAMPEVLPTINAIHEQERKLFGEWAATEIERTTVRNNESAEFIRGFMAGAGIATVFVTVLVLLLS